MQKRYLAPGVCSCSGRGLFINVYSSMTSYHFFTSTLSKIRIHPGWPSLLLSFSEEHVFLVDELGRLDSFFSSLHLSKQDEDVLRSFDCDASQYTTAPKILKRATLSWVIPCWNA